MRWLLLCIVALGVTACTTTVYDQADLHEFVLTLPANSSGIIPGKVMVDNVTPGTVVRGAVAVKNGEDHPTRYAVYYKPPDHVDPGWVKAPPEVKNWVTVTDPNPIIPAATTLTIPVEVRIPATTTLPPQWEFLIAMKNDEGQSNGMGIIAEMATRWLMSSPKGNWTPVWIGVTSTLALASLVVIVLQIHQKRRLKEELARVKAFADKR